MFDYPLLWGIGGLLLGGVLKGATGAGGPIIAIPALTMAFDVRTAVTLMLVPNLLTNIGQAWSYRRDLLSRGYLVQFAGGGMVGVVIGSVMLVMVSAEALSLLVAIAVLGYVGLRVLKPGLWLPPILATRLAMPAGLAGGALQGATGISAPVSLTFLNAQRLTRPQFIGTISVFFVVVTGAQIPALYAFGLVDLARLGHGFGALGLVLLGMPLGAWLGGRFSATAFDRAILALLSVLALKILAEVLLGVAA